MFYKDLSSSSRIKKGAWKNASRCQSNSIFSFLCQTPQNDPPYPRVLVILALPIWLHMTQGCVICLFGVPKYAITWHEVEGQFGDMGILKKQYMPIKAPRHCGGGQKSPKNCVRTKNMPPYVVKVNFLVKIYMF